MKIRRAKSEARPKKGSRSSSRGIYAKHGGNGTLQKSERAKAEDLELTEQIVQHIRQGLTHTQSAKQLGISPSKVFALWKDFLDRSDALLAERAMEHLAKNMLRLDGLWRAWYLDAHGGVVVNPETGERREVKKDPEAARILIAATRAAMQPATQIVRAQMMNQVEVHTTAPVLVQQLNVEEVEAARIINMTFGDKAVSHEPAALAPALDT